MADRDSAETEMNITDDGQLETAWAALMAEPDGYWRTTQQVADLFDVREATVRRWIHQGKLQAKINEAWDSDWMGLIRRVWLTNEDVLENFYMAHHAEIMAAQKRRRAF